MSIYFYLKRAFEAIRIVPQINTKDPAQKLLCQIFILRRVFRNCYSDHLSNSGLLPSLEGTSVTRRKSPIVYKSCPKMISLEK